MGGPQFRSQDLNLFSLFFDGLLKLGTLRLQLLSLNLEKFVNPLKFHFYRGSLCTRRPAILGWFICRCKRCRLRAFLSLRVRLFLFRSVWPGQRWKGDQSQCYRANYDCSHRYPLIALCQSPKRHKDVKQVGILIRDSKPRLSICFSEQPPETKFQEYSFATLHIRFPWPRDSAGSLPVHPRQALRARFW